jgi:hypothetical protein
MRSARKPTPVVCVESDDSADDRVLVHGLHRCSGSMTILAFRETCTIGSNTVVFTDRLDLCRRHWKTDLGRQVNVDLPDDQEGCAETRKFGISGRGGWWGSCHDVPLHSHGAGRRTASRVGATNLPQRMTCGSTPSWAARPGQTTLLLRVSAAVPITHAPAL